MAEQERVCIASYTRSDFRVDTYRGSGPGGQHRNKTDSAVRITHIPSGLVSSCEASRSQHQNKKVAFRTLANKVLAWHRGMEAGRPERTTDTVRTYHGVENRVKDHASGFRQTYTEVMSDIGPMVASRRAWFAERSIQAGS